MRAIPKVMRDTIDLAPVDHGGHLGIDERIAPALVELLTTGSTTQLTSLPPQPERDATSVRPVRRLQQLPSDAELVAAGVGVQPRGRRVQKSKVTVAVVHGNLSRAESPVLVGHYDQDVFANAEAYLDRQLNGRLRERALMRLYPDAIGTALVELQSKDALPAAHPGAIVVGLGTVGELTAGSLLSTLETGLTRYGDARVAMELRRARRSGWRRGRRAHRRPRRSVRRRSSPRRSRRCWSGPARPACPCATASTRCCAPSRAQRSTARAGGGWPRPRTRSPSR